MVGLGMVVGFGNFTTIQYLASIFGMAQENFMPPPLQFQNFRISQMAIIFIEVSHKNSTNFQKVSQNFTKFQSEKNNLQFKKYYAN